MTRIRRSMSTNAAGQSFDDGRPRKSVPLALALGAAALGATALWVRYEAKQAEREYPPLGKFAEVDGMQLHYFEGGAGRPVVLLHGNGVMATDFLASGLFKLLARRYRVFAFDRPGFGYTDRPRSRIWMPEAQADFFARAFRQLGIRQPIVLAHSWGTMVALALALNRPDDLSGLVLLSGYYYPSPRADAAFFSPPAIPVLGELLRYTVIPFVGRLIAPRLIRKMFEPCAVADSFHEAAPLPLLLRPSQVLAQAEESAFMIPGAARLANRYTELRVPITILAGAEDRAANYQRQSGRLHRDLPLSSFHVLPGVGHMLHYFEQDRVAQALDDVAALAPGRGSFVGTGGESQWESAPY